MPSKKTIDLQEFSDADLLNELKETETQFQKMRFDHAIKGLDNPLSIRDVRKDIARLNTELRRRELAKADEMEIAGRDRIRLRRRKK
ncbi:MAG: 50S ribosomal protein L29 [Saprospiraceae bacterium]|jgi:large subunit ribosomal protein L29|nr:50S ribosomal protein L29 [Saprospiraceae bacterium]